MARSGSLLVPRERLKILDFDIETRLVGFYEAGRFKPKGAEPTAIAVSWADFDHEPIVVAQPDLTVPEMLEFFLQFYEAADIVTGHYIRKFDLPILNGALFEHGMPLLGKKMASDTKVDLVNLEGLSKSQENLSEMLRLADEHAVEKYHMNDVRWRRATRLSPDGVAETVTRVSEDVRQHKALREALAKAGALKPPTEWSPRK